MNRLFFLIPMGLGVALVALFALGLGREHGPSYVPSAMIGKMAPDLVLPGIDSAEPLLTLADHLGEKVAVNFFASWCVPCRAEHPILQRLAETRGLRLIGIAYKDEPKDAGAFLSELGSPFLAVGVDLDGRAAIAFGITGVPETFILDPDGVIRYHLAGPLTEEFLDGEIAAIVAEIK